MKSKLRSKVLVLLFAMMMVLSACGKSASKTEVTPQPTETPVATETPAVTEEPTAAPTESADEQETSLKIVSFSPSITEIIFALGAEDMLVGRTKYCDFPEAAASIEEIGSFYTPDVEKVVSLEPDYLLASALWTDDVAQQFANAGIEVKTFEDSAHFDDVYTMISEIGTLLGKTTEAEELISQMKADVAVTMDKIKDADVKSVYYVVGYGEYGESTATGDTYINDMLTMAGGDNIAKDAANWSYSLEKLVEADPEVIIIGQYMYDDFISMDNYKDLSAVKNNQVYKIDNNLLDRQTNRMAQGVEEIAKILHPECFK